MASKQTDDYYRSEAKRKHAYDEEVEVDERAVVSKNDQQGFDNGAWVAAWVWIDDPEEEETGK